MTSPATYLYERIKQLTLKYAEEKAIINPVNACNSNELWFILDEQVNGNIISKNERQFVTAAALYCICDADAYDDEVMKREIQMGKVQEERKLRNILYFCAGHLNCSTTLYTLQHNDSLLLIAVIYLNNIYQYLHCDRATAVNWKIFFDIRKRISSNIFMYECRC